MTAKKSLLMGCAAVGAMAFVSMASAAPFNIAGPTASNIDTAPDDPTVLTFNVSETGIINSFGLSILIGCEGGVCDEGVSNSYWDNLSFSVSHGGVSALVFDLQTDNAGSESILDAIFEDGAPVLTVDDVVPSGTTAGTFGPADPFSVFLGLELSGEWTFTFFDNIDLEDDGTNLLSSSIFGTVRDDDQVPVPAPAGAGLLGLGLFGLGALGRRRKAA